MTPTHLTPTVATPPTAPPGHPGHPSRPSPPGRALRALRLIAVVACLPYLTLKVTWIADGRIGIPADSSLLAHRAEMIVANSVTVLLDACVIVLALLLTQAWGRKVKAWLLVLPIWVATGLLAPIMLGFPLQLLVRAFGGGATNAAAASEPFLHEWVFGVVYTGFIVQGLSLGALFVAYARGRWGHLWRGRVWELPRSPTEPAQRVLAVAAAVLALLPAGTQVLWATGATVGRGAEHARESTGALLSGVHALFAVAAVAGVLMLAFRLGRAVPVRVPLALAWVGSGALACWGGWLSVASLGSVDDIARQPTGLMSLTYAGQMIVGVLVAAIGAYFFAERAAAHTKRTATHTEHTAAHTKHITDPWP